MKPGRPADDPGSAAPAGGTAGTGGTASAGDTTGAGDTTPAGNTTPASGTTGTGDTTGAGDTTGRELPLRVTTLELFFDLVFAFTLTQLTELLSARLSLTGAAQVLLIFGLLWWMYGGYSWLTNNRPPVHTAERLLLLVGMAGFLTIGLAIPHGFAGDGLELGLGYLTVVLVHSSLYYRVNRHILRIAPFNIASALLVIIAGLLPQSSGGEGPAAYALWIAAIAIQLGSPLIVRPGGLFELRPAHLVERYTALVMVALGESVAAIGAGAAELAGHAGQRSGRLVTVALLGLALAAALWWIVFGDGDEEAAERVLTAASSERRTALALSAYFTANIPLLLGVVAVATGVQEAIAHAAHLSARPAAAVVLAVGAALFLAGDVAFRRQLRTGPVRLRMAAAVLALATAGLGAAVALDAQLALLTAILIATLILEHRPGGGRLTRRDVTAG